MMQAMWAEVLDRGLKVLLLTMKVDRALTTSMMVGETRG